MMWGLFEKKIEMGIKKHLTKQEADKMQILFGYFIKSSGSLTDKEIEELLKMIQAAMHI